MASILVDGSLCGIRYFQATVFAWKGEYTTAERRELLALNSVGMGEGPESLSGGLTVGWCVEARRQGSLFTPEFAS